MRPGYLIAGVVVGGIIGWKTGKVLRVFKEADWIGEFEKGRTGAADDVVETTESVIEKEEVTEAE